MRHLLLDALDSVPCLGRSLCSGGVGRNKDEDLNVFGSMGPKWERGRKTRKEEREVNRKEKG